MRRRLTAGGFALVAASVLLTACGAGNTAAACNIEVDTPDLVSQRTSDGIPDCPSTTASADLPDVSVACLGSRKSMTLSDIKGPAIINFWGSNCGPCRKEMPALAAFDKAYGDQVQLIGVDYADTYPGLALDLAKRSGVHYPSLADPCAALADSSLLVPGGLPFFYFVKADGTLGHDGKPLPGGLDSVDQIKALAETNLGITLKATS